MPILPSWYDRRNPETKHLDDPRDEFSKDYGRIIHSASFRRLQAKTQVLGLGDSDFYRTRLTHSLEVAQIGSGILSEIKRKFSSHVVLSDLPDDRLLEAICLSHDFGHPPFGHGGERALNFTMRKYGGFEGNAQTLRILSKLEHYSEKHGLNPTRRLSLGVLKYPVKYSESVNKNTLYMGSISDYKDRELKPPKCYYDCEKDVVDWVLKIFNFEDRNLFQSTGENKRSKYKSLDCSIMELADDISYSVHDFEDCLELGLINREVWEKNFRELNISNRLSADMEKWQKRLFSSKSNERKHGISNIVYYFVHSILLKINDGFESPILRYNFRLSDESEEILNFLQKIIFDEVIKTSKVRILEAKGQHIVASIFAEFLREPEEFLPKTTFQKYTKADTLKERIIADYVSGMTDEYASKIYQRFFIPKFGSVFDL